MNRMILVAVCCLSVFTACSENPIDRLIPLSATKGGLANVTVSDIDVQEKSINGGTLVSGFVAVPHDIKREQVKPTLLAAIKDLKDKYRKCEWIVVFAIPSPELKGTGIWAGKAEYVEGKIQVDYGIPSAAQIAEPIEKEFKKLHSDYEPVRLMSKEDFDLAVAVNTTWQKIHVGLLDEANKYSGEVYMRKVEKISDARLLKLTSQKMNLPEAKVKSLMHQLGWYYSPLWGNETIG